jgi:hypothetical protein
MVLEEVTTTPAEIVSGFLLEVGKIVLWLQAIGIILILWILFQIITLIINRKMKKTLYSLKDDLKHIESKVDKLVAKKKR